MCGRFILKVSLGELEEIVEPLKDDEGLLADRYNIAPSQNVTVIKENSLCEMKWGLVPNWAKDIKKITPQINARSETVKDKPFFRDAFNKTRCVVPARGFYEWKRQGDLKQAFFISLKDDSLFFFAGLYANSPLVGETFCILTCEPNELMEDIHNRMPVIFSKEQAIDWMKHKKVNIEAVESDKMKSYAVSSLVNSPKNDSIKCLEAI